MMKIYIIAGEASGDLHGSNLMKAMLKENPDINFRFWGGDQMARVAGTPRMHIKDLAFMGFLEVFLNIRTIIKNISFCKRDILDFRPDALVLIDYPGFNLRIAKWAKKQNVKVLYYISPQIWAWKQNRGHFIRKVVDEMYCILPFEKEFYKKFNVNAHFVGHPLIDAIDNFKAEHFNEREFRLNNQLDERPILAILPGSRNQEIRVNLPIMIDSANAFLERYQIVVAGAPNKTEAFYRDILKNRHIKVVYGKTYEVLSCAHMALVTSGTATLEAALFSVPQVVCYRGSWISYQIARRLIQVKYISLVNLIMDQPLVKELIQGDCTSQNMTSELNKLEAGEERVKLLDAYQALALQLGGNGASERAAKHMLKTIVQG
jgi:lipid-A-disaccharide synthase